MNDRCQCGAESEFGAHGVTEGAVYSEHYCEACWNRKDRGLPVPPPFRLEVPNG